ncbi:hypothetical protein [Desulfopila sp. IMCC35008]|uniref:hypothetical protein n=1 Tax=Desulfopila sp. IMCC35008 TaxID=2653858 RepID=UPI0013D80A03|nr:hypothetical protein [Desulfopila sp. IMCC35008]
MRKAQVQSRAETTTSLRAEATTEVSKVSIALVAVFAAIVGLWSLACIVGGIVSSGGVGGLLSGWFKAVTGM